MAFLLSSVDGKRARSPLSAEELPDLTVGEVRRRAAEMTSVPVERITLLYCGRILKEDDGKLTDHGVKRGSSVYVIR